MDNLLPRPSDKQFEWNALQRNTGATGDALEYPVWPASHFEQKNLLDYARAAFRHKVLLTAATLAGLGLGLGIAITQPRMYRAHASLEFQDPSDAVLHPKDAEAGAGVLAESYLQTQIRILQSETLVDRVVDRMHPVRRQDAPLDVSRFASWKRDLGWKSQPKILTEEDYAELFMRNLTVQSPDQTRIVEIACDFPNPQLAAEFVNRLTEEYMARLAEGRWNTAVDTEKWLDEQVGNLKRTLEQSEAELQSYASTMGLVGTDEKDSLPSAKLRDLQTELSKAEADRIAKQSQYEMATSSSASSLPAVLDNGPLKEYQIKLTELRRQLAELNATLTAANPRILKLQPQIAELEQTMERERANVVTRIQNEYESALRREKMLNDTSATQAARLNAQAGQFIRYDLLRHEVDINRRLYEALLEKVKEYSVSVTMQTNQVRVIDSAKVPSGPYRPSVKLHGLVGLAGGLLFGFGLALFRDRGNQMVLEPGEATRHLNVSELGIIPSMEAAVRGGAFLRSLRKQSGTFGYRQIRASPHGTSLFTDSVRAVVTSILSAISESHARVLIFSSPASQDGKTTAVSHVGTALSETGRRVLLVDADLRKPRLHGDFGMTCNWGLADILRANIDLTAVNLDSLVIKTPLPNLFVLPAGLLSGSIADTLYSSRFPDLIRRFRGDFDLILIDSPPVAYLPDARIIGCLADAMILVLRSGRTNREEAILTCRRLVADRIPLLGTILNDWQPKRTAYSYYNVTRPA